MPDQRPLDAGALVQLPSGAATRVEYGASGIALVNDRGRLFAIADLCLRCSHRLSGGKPAGGLLACPQCGWLYDLERGCVAGLPALRMEMHGVRIDDGHVVIEPHSRSGRPDVRRR